MSNSEYGVVQQDQIVADLVRLHGTAPHEIAQAGGRIMERIRERTERELSEKRTSILVELEIIERARNIVLGSEEPPAVSDAEQLFSSGVRTLDVPVEPDVPALCQAKLLHDTVSVLREYEEKHGDLDRTPAIEAYLIDYTERYRDGEQRHGHEPTPDAELIEERRRELDPENVSICLHALPYQLGVEISERMSQAPDRVRTASEWWEVLVLVLTIECPDLKPEELGLAGELPWGGWERVGGNTFGHRDGMRAYIGRAPWDDGKALKDDKFWTLAARAGVLLRAHVPALSRAELGATDERPGDTNGASDQARSGKRTYSDSERASAIGIAASRPGITLRQLEKETGIPRATLNSWPNLACVLRHGRETMVREKVRGQGRVDDDGRAWVEGIEDSDIELDGDSDS